MQKRKYQEAIVKQLLESFKLAGPEYEETPRRVVETYELCTRGKRMNPLKFCERKMPTTDHEMSVIGPIDFFSMCPHHLLPFFGTVQISIIPGENRIGLSKYISIVQCISEKPQLQEDFTNEIANVIEKGMKPMGVMVVVEGTHTCMMIRGSYDYSVMTKTRAKTITSALRGVFAWHESPRAEAQRLGAGGEKNV